MLLFVIDCQIVSLVRLCVLRIVATTAINININLSLMFRRTHYRSVVNC